ncbi:hypothetical protein AAGC89_16205 [Proteus mirabilis]
MSRLSNLACRTQVRASMLDGCDDPQCEPVQRFKEKYTRIK